MPLSSVLGASSVIKPGVCTSTTRPSVPYEGQLIYETDTDRVAAWNGSAWVYETAVGGPPGLVYLTGATFTTVASVSLPNSTFTTTYRNYKIILHITAAAANGDATMRLRASGTDDSTSNYRYAQPSLTSTNSTSNFNSNGTTSWKICEYDTAVGMMSVDLIAPQLSLRTLMTGTMTYGNASFNQITGTIGALFTATTQFDACSFIFSSNATGIYRVYGYADS